jgi:hypothetical protein
LGKQIALLQAEALAYLPELGNVLFCALAVHFIFFLNENLLLFCFS